MFSRIQKILGAAPNKEPQLFEFTWQDTERIGENQAQNPAMLKQLAKRFGVYYHKKDYISDSDQQTRATSLCAGTQYVYVSHH